jgi:hypothetical protein
MTPSFFGENLQAWARDAAIEVGEMNKERVGFSVTIAELGI